MYKHKPIFTWLLIILITLMYLTEIIFNALHSDKAIIMLGAKWNYGITNGELWRFFTCTLLHGNLLHYSLNIFALYIFGREVESIYGSVRFFVIYMYSSWGASLMSYAFSKNISIGASGAVFGIVSSLLVFFFIQKEIITHAKIRFKEISTLIVINLLFGCLLPRVDNYSHIGGTLTGLIISYLISPRYNIQINKAEHSIEITNKPTQPIQLLNFIGITWLLYFITTLCIKLHKLSLL